MFLECIEMDFTVAEISEVALRISDATNGIPRKDRKYLFKKFKQCFTGQEAVTWLLQNSSAQTRQQAVVLGQILLKKGIISHVCNEHPFLDKGLFYCLTEDIMKQPTQKSSKTRIQKFNSKLKMQSEKTSSKARTIDHGSYHSTRFSSDGSVTSSSSHSLHSARDLSSSSIEDGNSRNNSENSINFGSTSTSDSCSPLSHALLGMTPVQTNYNLSLTEREQEIHSERSSKSDSGRTSRKGSLLDATTSLGEGSDTITLRSQTSPSSKRELTEELRGAATRMKNQETGVALKDRKYMLKKYPACFTGRDAITWLVENDIATSRETARQMGNLMMRHNVFYHVAGEHLLEDKRLFYVFAENSKVDKSIQERHRLLFSLSEEEESCANSGDSSDNSRRSTMVTHRRISKSDESMKSSMSEIGVRADGHISKSSSLGSNEISLVSQMADAYISHTYDLFGDLLSWWMLLPHSVIVSLLKIPSQKNVAVEVVASALTLMDMHESPAPFLLYNIKRELTQNDSIEVAFRCDTIYLQIVSEAMKLYAATYLGRQISHLLLQISQLTDSKSANLVDICVESFLHSVLSSKIPGMVLFILHQAATVSSKIFSSKTEGAQMSVVALFFLRCVVPAIINPGTLGLQSPLVSKTQKILLKIAKEIQSFASCTLSPATRNSHRLWTSHSDLYWKFCKLVEHGSEEQAVRVNLLLSSQAEILKSCSKLFYMLDMYHLDVEAELEGEHREQFQAVYYGCKTKKTACAMELVSHDKYSTFFLPRDFKSVTQWFEMERVSHRYTLLLYFKKAAGVHRLWLKSFSPFCEQLMYNDACIIAVVDSDEGKAKKLEEEWLLTYSVIGDEHQELQRFLVSKICLPAERVKSASVALIDTFENCLYKWALPADAEIQSEIVSASVVLKNLEKIIGSQASASTIENCEGTNFAGSATATFD